MLLVVFLAVAILFIVLGIVFALGKGANLIAGYNTASPDEKAGINEKKLLRTMAIIMFVLAGCFIISALSEIINVKVLIWIGQSLFVITIITAVIYMNTGNRFKK